MHDLKFFQPVARRGAAWEEKREGKGAEATRACTVEIIETILAHLIGARATGYVCTVFSTDSLRKTQPARQEFGHRHYNPWSQRLLHASLRV